MRILFLLCTMFFGTLSFAQYPLRNARPAMTYKIKSPGGTNACAVTYNAKQGLYYTAFAGNTTYPLEAFDDKGQNRYAGQIGMDIRSMWYNPKKNSLEGYVFPQKGKFAIKLGKDGTPTAMAEPKEQENEIPYTQSTACLVGKNKLYYFNGSLVYVLNVSNLKQKSRFSLSSIPGDMANLNSTTLIYTGVKGYELGFYDAFEGKIYFTDLKGNYTGTTLLPSSAPKASTFKFSYANNMVWLYDVDERTWYSYWVF